MRCCPLPPAVDPKASAAGQLKYEWRILSSHDRQVMYRNLVASRNGSSTLLECHDEAERETFEYHGIHAMWEIGQVNSGRDDIVFYFHSKGLTHYKEWKDYEANDNLFKLTEKTLGEVDLVFEVFDLFPEVNKVGNKMSELGWVWYNFMFARGSYLKRVAEPIISSVCYSPTDGTWNRWDDKEWKVQDPPMLPNHSGSGLLFTCISFCTVCLV